jgi:hypothetical protein
MLDFCCACAAVALLVQVQTVGSGYIQLPPQKRFEGVVVQPPTVAVSTGSRKHSSAGCSGQLLLTRAQASLRYIDCCFALTCSTWITQTSFMLGIRVLAGMLVATRVATQEHTGEVTRPTAGIMADRSAPVVRVATVRLLAFVACSTYGQPSYCCLYNLNTAQLQVSLRWSMIPQIAVPQPYTHALFVKSTASHSSTPCQVTWQPQCQAAHGPIPAGSHVQEDAAGCLRETMLHVIAFAH